MGVRPPRGTLLMTTHRQIWLLRSGAFAVALVALLFSIPMAQADPGHGRGRGQMRDQGWRGGGDRGSWSMRSRDNGSSRSWDGSSYRRYSGNHSGGGYSGRYSGGGSYGGYSGHG